MKRNLASSVGWGRVSAAQGLRHFFSLHPRGAACSAFVAMVCACLLAAAMVASHDVPLVLGGL